MKTSKQTSAEKRTQHIEAVAAILRDASNGGEDSLAACDIVQTAMALAFPSPGFPWGVVQCQPVQVTQRL